MIQKEIMPKVKTSVSKKSALLKKLLPTSAGAQLPKIWYPVSKIVLDIARTNVFEKRPVLPFGASFYLVILCDHCSRIWWIHAVEYKAGGLSTISRWSCMVQCQTCRKVRGLQLDKVLEYLPSEIRTFMSKWGTRQQVAALQSLRQNLIAKMHIRAFHTSFIQ